MKRTNLKLTHCHTCERDFHSLGIARHVAMHRDKEQDCQVTFTHGDTYTYRFSERESKRND